MGSKLTGPRIIPTWAATVGSMKSAGTVVMATCNRNCGFTRKPIDLDPIMEKFGADYSLWDKRQTCPTCKARRSVIFMCRPAGPITPMRPCLT